MEARNDDHTFGSVDLRPRSGRDFRLQRQGAGEAMPARLDVFGVVVISFVTGLGEGISRDVLIASPPPQAPREWRCPAACFGLRLAAVGLHWNLAAGSLKPVG
jgi:uncharacterized membrane protein YeiH